MCCICKQYRCDEESSEYQDYWKFQKNIYMGKLYKCEYCGALWAEYMSGHGWMMYYKKAADSIFEPPALDLQKQKPKKNLDETMMRKWEELTRSIPNEGEWRIENIRIPSDVMSVLKCLFKNEKDIRRWLFTCREKSMQFELPISIMKEDGGMDAIRSLLLKKYYS